MSVVDGAAAGCITTRPEGTTRWIEQFYLPASPQWRGIGGSVLRSVIAEAHEGLTRLNVLQERRATPVRAASTSSSTARTRSMCG
ncbi:hypothetical protein [Microbacterium arborescens]|uniref:hypothetical protein n=1 Tax=Microbacterium arborescens TaxID=33883 RepID=UPI003C75037B